MKLTKYALIVLSLVFLVSQTTTAENIILEWEYEGDQPDGFRIFAAVPYQDASGNWSTTYDYTLPVTTPIYQDGNISAEARFVEINLPGRADLVTSYNMVARAFRGDQESIDSNTVSHKVVLVPPIAPIELSGSFAKDDQIIMLEWQQPPDKWDISRWVVYYKTDGEYNELGGVDGDQELKLEQPFNGVLDGARNTVVFSVVAFRKSGVFSTNSNEFAIDIDRREVAPIHNLRIRVEIPL